MRLTLAAIALTALPLAASAQEAAFKMDQLLEKGWEPFSAQFVGKLSFLIDDKGNKVELPAYTVFLRKKGGLAYCGRATGNSKLGFCNVIKEAQE